MNLKAKPYQEAHKQKVQADLAARVELLKARGIEGRELEKDPRVRKLKADIRKANSRLARVAATEQRNSEKIQQKQEKSTE